MKMRENKLLPVFAEMAALVESSKIFDWLISVISEPDRPVDVVRLNVSLFMFLDACGQSMLVLLNIFNLVAPESKNDHDFSIIIDNLPDLEIQVMSLGCDIGHYSGRIWFYGAELLSELLVIRTAIPSNHQRIISNLNAETGMDVKDLKTGDIIGFSMFDERDTLRSRIAECIPLILNIPNSEITTEFADALEKVGFNISGTVIALKRMHEFSDNEERDTNQVLLRLDAVIYRLSKLSAALARFSPVSDQLWTVYDIHHGYV